MLKSPELVGNWTTEMRVRALHWFPKPITGMSNADADTYNGFAVRSLPDSGATKGFRTKSGELTPRTIASPTRPSTWERGGKIQAAIDNGPMVTKAGVRRGRNDLPTPKLELSKTNPASRKLVSHSKILLDKASAKKEKALSIPEQVHAMIRKAKDLENSIAKKLERGQDATNLIKCLSVLQNRVRFLLDHCEEKGMKL